MARVLRIAPVLFLLTVAGCFSANPADKLKSMPPNTGFKVHAARSGEGVHKYSVFAPRDYNPQKKYPTIVFLHGIGEAGSDGIKCTTVGIGPAIARKNGDFPFIVVFPQYGWDWTSDSAGKLVCDVLDDAEKQYSIDKDRVTLTGLSSGGKGTWTLGARYPERWNALVPMGGYSDDDAVPKLVKARMPVWALHNSGDMFVMVGGTRSMVKQLHEKGMDNNTVRYTEYGDIGHNCWDKAYDSGELFVWLQQQKRNGRMASAK